MKTEHIKNKEQAARRGQMGKLSGEGGNGTQFAQGGGGIAPKL